MSLFEVISGSEFNEKYEGIIFYKLTNDTENHHGLQYKDGLNEDIIPFSPKGECTLLTSRASRIAMRAPPPITAASIITAAL